MVHRGIFEKLGGMNTRFLDSTMEEVLLIIYYILHLPGTSVQILKPRKFDDSAAGFEKWKFMSVASWGEDPRGCWTLDIVDEVVNFQRHLPFIKHCSVIYFIR